MARALTMATCFVALAAAMSFAGCGASDTTQNTVYASAGQPAPRPKNTKRISASDLVGKLASAGLEAKGLEAKDLGAAQMSEDDVSRFPEEPRSTLRLRVSDGQGNSAPMTFVEFGSWKAAAALDAKPVNGFAVRNWFVLGTVNNYFVKRVSEALAG